MDTDFSKVVEARKAEINVIIKRHGFEIEDENGDYITACHKGETKEDSKEKALNLRNALSGCKGIEFDFSAEENESYVDIYLRA